MKKNVQLNSSQKKSTGKREALDFRLSHQIDKHAILLVLANVKPVKNSIMHRAKFLKTFPQLQQYRQVCLIGNKIDPWLIIILIFSMGTYFQEHRCRDVTFLKQNVAIQNYANVLQLKLRMITQIAGIFQNLDGVFSTEY